MVPELQAKNSYITESAAPPSSACGQSQADVAEGQGDCGVLRSAANAARRIDPGYD